jgi:hypothetical protein
LHLLRGGARDAPQRRMTFPLLPRRPALVASALLAIAAISDGAGACPVGTSADYALYPSTLRTVQPEPLVPGGTPTACPGGTNAPPCGGHQIYVPAANNPESTGRRRNQLFLFLPGSSSLPDQYDGLLSMAAYTGYKTIGLSYDNTNRMETVCGNTCGCYGPARREVILGGALSPNVSIQTGDTIVNRLYVLLVYLRANFPAEGWGVFLSRDDNDGVPEFTDIDWDSIVISGHSQGAGHAMMMTKMDNMDGILLFDGGNDDCTSGGRTYAQWHDLPNFAAPRRSFNHDRGGTFVVPPSFLAMDFGTVAPHFTNLDTTWPIPHLVATTNQTPVAGCAEHGSMAYDGCMPDAAGNVPATPGDAYLFPYYVEWMCTVGN